MTLDRLARRYGGRPSAYVGPLRDDLALSLDLLCERAGMEEQADALRHMRGGAQPVVIVGGM